MDRDQMLERVRQLEADLEAVRAQLADDGVDAPSDVVRTSRRHLLRDGALAVGAGLAGMAVAAAPAGAVDGDALTIGEVNVGTSSTELRTIGTGQLSGSVLSGQDGSYSTNSFPAGLGGLAVGDRVHNGVYAYTESLGSSIFHGYSVAAVAINRGIDSRAQLVLVPSGGAPTDDEITHRVGEIVAAGSDLWYCTVGGTPGTWARLNTPEVLLPTPERAVSALSLANTETSSAQGLAGGGVPAGATSATVTVTAVPAGNSTGFVSIYDGTQSIGTPSFASVTWNKGNIVSNTTTVALTDGTVKLYASTAATVFVDVIGYVV